MEEHQNPEEAAKSGQKHLESATGDLKEAAGAKIERRLFGENKPQFAILDAAFHRALSDAAASYAASREWIDQGIRHTVAMAQASATQVGVRRNCSRGSTPAATGNLGSRSKKPIPKEGSLSCAS